MRQWVSEIIRNFVKFSTMEIACENGYYFTFFILILIRISTKGNFLVSDKLYIQFLLITNFLCYLHWYKKSYMKLYIWVWIHDLWIFFIILKYNFVPLQYNLIIYLYFRYILWNMCMYVYKCPSTYLVDPEAKHFYSWKAEKINGH